MKIGLLTRNYKPEVGAAPNRLYEMMRGLRDCGDEVCVVTAMLNYPTGRIFDGYRHRFSCCETLDGIEVKRFWIYATNVKRALPRMWNELSFTLTAFCAVPYLRRRKLDFLIVGSPPLPLGYVGRWIARLSGARFVANISDVWPLTAKEMGAMREGRLYSALEHMERSIYRHADVVLGQSEEIVSHVEKHGASDVYLFRNGVDPARFAGFPHTGSGDTERFHIVYVGMLGFAQGLLNICKAVDFAALGAQLDIYGMGGEQEAIAAYTTAHPERGALYHGPIRPAEVPSVMQRADISLVPLIRSIYGAVPSKIYESMAGGVPILFFGDGEGARIVSANGLGLVAGVKDFATLAQKIGYASAHRDTLAQMSARCVECAGTLFNRPQQVVRLHEYLCNALKRH